MPAASESDQVPRPQRFSLFCRYPQSILRVGSMQVAGVRYHRYRVEASSGCAGKTDAKEFACPPKVLLDLTRHAKGRAILLIDTEMSAPALSGAGVQTVVAHLDVVESSACAIVHLDCEFCLDKLVVEGTQVRLSYPGGEIHLETWVNVAAAVEQALGIANPPKKVKKLTIVRIKGRTRLHRISSGILLRGDVHIEVGCREGTSVTVLTPPLDAPTLRLLRRWPPLVKRVSKETDAEHRRIYSVDASPIASKQVAATLVIALPPAEMFKYHLHGGFLYHADTVGAHEHQSASPVVREPVATVAACDGMQIDVDCEFAPSRDNDIAVDVQRITIGDTILILDTADQMSSVATELAAVCGGSTRKRQFTRLVVRGLGRLDTMGEHPTIYGTFDVSLASRADVVDKLALASSAPRPVGVPANQPTSDPSIGPTARSALTAPPAKAQRTDSSDPAHPAANRLAPKLRNFLEHLESAEQVERYADARRITRKAAKILRSGELRALAQRLHLDQDRQAAWEKLIAYASRARAHEFMCLDTEFLIPIDIQCDGGWVSYCVWEDLKPRTATYVFRTPDFDTQSRVRAFLHEAHPKRNRLKMDRHLQRRLGYVGIAIHNNAGTNEADYWWERIRVRLGLQ